LIALAPSGPALTTRNQPTLFYFQSGTPQEAAARSLTFTLVEPGVAEPLLKAVANQSEPGIRRLQLARHGVSLKPGVRYDWRVALSEGGEERSKDVFASAPIQYTEPSQALLEALQAEPERKAEIYAEHGIWYDALVEISNQILENPQNQDLLALRASLLEQVGLGRVLDWKHQGRQK
jgi:hypothetical protein